MSTSSASKQCNRFSIAEIKSATNQFNSKILGQGGEAKVYYGEIYIGLNKTPVAVKHLKDSSRGFEMEIETVSKIQHPNLVSLVGYCDESSYKILVYEYMEKGCLSDYLKKNSPVCLTWLQRLHISVGAARGLEYLHTKTSEFPNGIIHRDVKPSNILVGENWVGKLSDFGMFKCSTIGQDKSLMTTTLKGTCGYYAPEYVKYRRVTTKIDVYSFGVVLFEVLCRKMPWDREDESYYHDEDEDLGAWAQQNVDAQIQGEVSGDSLTIFTDIIRRSLQMNPIKRPTMDVVVLDLQKALECQEAENIAKQLEGSLGFLPKPPRECEGKSSIVKVYSLEEVSRHRKKDDFWIIISGKVYDLTSFMDEHPGGDEVFLSSKEDATQEFEDIGHSDYAIKMMGLYYVGDFNGYTVEDDVTSFMADHLGEDEDSMNRFEDIGHSDDEKKIMESDYEGVVDVSTNPVKPYTDESIQQHTSSFRELQVYPSYQKAIAGVPQGSTLDAVLNIFRRDVSNLLSFQAQYVEEFQSQFQNLSHQLSFMRGYIPDKEKLKGNSETVKAALKYLRELVYDADDLVIDCLIHEDSRKSSYFSLTFPHDIFFRYRTGKKLITMNSRILKMIQVLNTYRISSGEQISNEGSGNLAQRQMSQIFNQSQMVGLEEDVKIIKSWIFARNVPLHLVGIVGMGGLGKTSIARKIFKDEQVRERFRERIWLSISQSSCEINIMKSILKQLEVDCSTRDSWELFVKVREALSRTTYLIVLDDIWSLENDWWARISEGLPQIPGKSNCIIITSRIEDVVKQMGVVEARIYRPRFLDYGESWLLFCKFAFRYNAETCPDHQLDHLGKLIVMKCHGLPLAITTVGKLLYSKKHPSEWECFLDNFDGKLDSVMASLQMSFDELPSSLKYCILCFSVYPEDYEIKAEQLVRWWVGEGFVHDVGSHTAVENGFSYLTQLISRSLVEVVQKRRYDGRVYRCKINELVRNLLVLNAKEEAFSSFSSNYVQIPTADSRRLGITSGDMNFEDLRGNSKLRALLLMTDYPITFNRSSALAQVNTLRVLDLHQLTLKNVSNEDLWHWICSLKRLVYLNLGAIKDLFVIPNSIGKLRMLQSLILAECINLKTLPASIGKLSQLKVLDVRNCIELSCLPQGLRNLENLQELYGFKVPTSTDRDGCHLGELRNLTKLHILFLEFRDGSIIKDEDVTVLEHHDSLRVLSINANNLVDKDLLVKLNRFSPPKKVEEVYLKCYYGDKVPQWLNPSSLPNLKYLCMEDFSNVTSVKSEFWGDGKATWKVEGLCMKYLPRLQMNWKTLKCAMPLLRYTETRNCYMLKDFPCEVLWEGTRKEEQELETIYSSEEDEIVGPRDI